MDKQIEFNKKVHDKIAKKYSKRHADIYNDFEQERLAKTLSEAVSLIKTSSEPKVFLDYGCGDGNLSNHLIKFNQKVISADVSQGFLDLIKNIYPSNNLSTLLLNGVDMSNVGTESIDLVAIYSVLHHIPDYLNAVKDICRVLKKGGILFLDREASPEYWESNKSYAEFLSQVKKPFNPLILFNLLNPFWYVRKYNKIKNPKWQSEGDIHVWKDDHIEWDLIHKQLKESNFEIIIEKNYLRYYPDYPMDLYEKYQKLCTDLRYIVAIKKG